MSVIGKGRAPIMIPPDQPCPSRQDVPSQAPSRPMPSDVKGTDSGTHTQRKSSDALTLLITNLQNPSLSLEPRGHPGHTGELSLSHDDLLSPMITQYKGDIVRTPDAALMATFPNPHAAVQSAIAMQRVLRDHNRRQALSAQTHIRIGIHSAPGIGPSSQRTDVVPITRSDELTQVATRVESRALPDQILISGTTYEQLPMAFPPSARNDRYQNAHGAMKCIGMSGRRSTKPCLAEPK